jgi:hypothetical protein
LLPLLLLLLLLLLFLFLLATRPSATLSGRHLGACKQTRNAIQCFLNAMLCFSNIGYTSVCNTVGQTFGCVVYGLVDVCVCVCVCV